MIRLPYFVESSYFVTLLRNMPKDKLLQVDLIIPAGTDSNTINLSLFDEFNALAHVNCSLLQEQISYTPVDIAALQSSQSNATPSFF